LELSTGKNPDAALQPGGARSHVSDDWSIEEWKDEAYKAYVARWKAHEAEESERRRQGGEVAIWLGRSPDDAQTFTRDHQAELHELLGPLLRDKELKVDAPFMALDSADAVSGYTGEVIIALAYIARPLITHALVAWIRRKPGRKIRVEFHPGGKVKTVEAQTEEQVLSIAKALEQEARARESKAKPE
jgi:hypothetical protein